MPASTPDPLLEIADDLQDDLLRIFGPDTPTWALFRIAPAAKRYHQAYQHGLLEHCLSVAQAVSAIIDLYNN